MDKERIVIEALHEIAETLDEHISEQLQTIGIDQKDLRVLRALKKRHDEGFTPALGDFATMVGRAKSWTSIQVQSLTKRGLVRRVPHPRDRRQSNVEMTSAGERALAKAEEVYARTGVDMLGSYATHEIETLRELLVAFFDH